MAHGDLKIFDDSYAEEMIMLTHAYHTLFHRTLLKLLGYEGMYIDYATLGLPKRHIDEPVGE